MKDKVVSKQLIVIKHSSGTLFNNYLLYKNMAALTFPRDSTTHKATPTAAQEQKMDVSDPHSHGFCVNSNSTPFHML